MLPGATKGLLVGAATTIIVAIVIGVRETSSAPSRMIVPLMFAVGLYGIVPGTGAGAFAGWLAGRVRVFRRSLVVSIALAGTGALGVLTVPDLIPTALLVTIPAALVLERWTRGNPDLPRGRPLPPAMVGFLVALANVTVMAFVVGYRLPRIPAAHRLVGTDPLAGLQVALAVFVLGGIVALPLGTLTGWVAGCWSRGPIAIRRLVLCGMAVGVLAFVAALPDPLPSRWELAGSALPSTVLAALVLEQRTRRGPPLPTAKALARGA